MKIKLNNTDYEMGVDYATTSYTVTDVDGLQVVGEDPAFCEHEWWEDTMVTYTTSPPMKRWVCRLCGMERFVHTGVPTQSFRWKRV